MLEEAHVLLGKDVDVKIGIIEDREEKNCAHRGIISHYEYED